MRIYIIEDEIPASEKLTALLQEYLPEAKILGVGSCVEDALAWLKENGSPDLLFSDIELLDGNVFHLFDQFEVTCPIIFTTAYDQFLLKAFQTNGIAYLLKPFAEVQLREALAKYHQLFGDSREVFLKEEVVQELKQALQPAFRQYRNRFAIKRPTGIILLTTDQIRSIQAEDNIVFAYAADGKRHPLNFTLSDLETQLDPAHFFRLNRSAFVRLDAITKIEPYFNDRLAVSILGASEKLITSAGRTPSFRKWVEG